MEISFSAIFIGLLAVCFVAVTTINLNAKNQCLGLGGLYLSGKCVEYKELTQRNK